MPRTGPYLYQRLPDLLVSPFSTSRRAPCSYLIFSYSQTRAFIIRIQNLRREWYGTPCVSYIPHATVRTTIFMWGDQTLGSWSLQDWQGLLPSPQVSLPPPSTGLCSSSSGQITSDMQYIRDHQGTSDSSVRTLQTYCKVLFRPHTTLYQ